MKRFHIDVTNLTEQEEVDLLLTIFDFAHTKLPEDKILNIGVQQWR